MGRKVAFGAIVFTLLYVLIIPTISAHVAALSDETPGYWPTLGWRYSTPDEQGLNSSYLGNMMDYIHNKSLPIDSVVIVRHGYVILEEYGYGFERNSSHYLASVTKSFCSALVGIAIKEGYIDSVNHKVLDFFPNRTIANMSSWKQDMTLDNLLTMTSGIPWSDDVESDIMYESANAVQYVLDRPVTRKPGTTFIYCSGGSHLLSAIINTTTDMDTLAYARERLFNPLGISSAYWSRDKSGIPWGHAYLYMRPLDVAKFGYLYLKGGVWDNQQIIPAEWVAKSTNSFVSVDQSLGYGYQWWINSEAKTYEARGALGQRIIISPECDMVVVFTGGFEQDYFSEEDYLFQEFILKSRMRIRGDVYFDWTVDIFDLTTIAISFGGPPPIWNLKADINKDGVVDIFDLAIVAVDFGKTN